MNTCKKTPPGILEMLSIKGIGPKKISTIWKELDIETLGELLYACNENRLTLYKGFGEKTQQNIKESIEFYMGSLGSFLYQQIETYAAAIDEKLKSQFAKDQFILTGELRRQLDVIEKIEWVTTTSLSNLKTFFIANDFAVKEETSSYISFKGKENVTIGFFCCDATNFYSKLFTTSCSETFLSAWNSITNWDVDFSYKTEEEIFFLEKIDFIPPFRRETEKNIIHAKSGLFTIPIQPNDIKSIIHSHSKWSDGNNKIEEMVVAAIKKGLEYLVLSDHSKSAFYANGLYEERIIEQHKEIDELNKKYPNFRIFKSIESDILNGGSLDYDDNVLANFDLVIASVHSNLKMNEEKAMMRLMNAIENPYTSILGHMTGRLLLSRNGYPVDHKKIIEACAANDVVIELNAHPRRLDIDWRWIDYALEKGVLLSIDPDAHSIEGFDDCRYGVLVAQKTGLTKEKNLSSFSLKEFETFLVQQHSKRN